METTKLLETERENRNPVHFYRNGTDETWNVYGKSTENVVHINPGLHTLTDRAELSGTQVTHLKVTIEWLEEYGPADHCVAVDDKCLELKPKN